MNTKTIEMPDVSQCQVAACAYNRDNGCRARAITVGDGSNPACDTFFSSENSVSAKQVAGVGACKVAGCKFNEDLECQADAIIVASAQAEAACQTFAV